jgi:cytochrome c556
MRRTFALSLLAICVALGLTVIANEKPTVEYQNVMKSNASTMGATGLRAHVTAKDYDAIAMDAVNLKVNFAKVEAFWTYKKAADAIDFAKAGGKAATALGSAAMAKDDAGIAAATMAIAPTCGGCHMAHREALPDKTFEIK